MKRNSKGGRPPKPRQFRRSHRLQLLLTPAEHRDLAEYAKRKKLTTSEIVRGCLRSLFAVPEAKGGVQ
jgi:hypothetical protein